MYNPNRYRPDPKRLAEIAAKAGPPGGDSVWDRPRYIHAKPVVRHLPGGKKIEYPSALRAYRDMGCAKNYIYQLIQTGRPAKDGSVLTWA